MFFGQHIRSEKADFDQLVLCGGEANPDRLGRTNGSFFPLTKINQIVNWFKDEIPAKRQVISFPSVRDEIGAAIVLSASKWPKNRVEVLFDLRDKKTKDLHNFNKPS